MMTESDLYCMAMESETAYRHMEEICKRLGYQFPPRLEQKARHCALPDTFLEKGTPAPVNAGI